MSRLLTSLAGWSLLVGVAYAQDVPSVGIVGVHQADLDVEAQRAGAEVLVEAIDASDFFEAKTPMWIADRLDGREAIVLQEAFLGPGRSMMEDGHTLYNQALVDDAVPVLERAVDALVSGMATARSSRDLWDAEVYLGAARLAQGDYRGSREAFEHAVSLNPLRSPSAAEFPPDLVQRYEDVRRERVGLARDVSVMAGDDGTEVWLNGERKGVVPLVVEDVVPGRNVFSGVSPLGYTAFEVVEVPESGRFSVDLRLSEPTLAEPETSRAGQSRQVASLYRALGESAGVDLLLVAGTGGGRATVQLYSPRTDTWSAPIETSYVGNSADELARVIPDLLVTVKDDATFDLEHRASLPEPLDVSSNGLLSRMLVLDDDLFADERVKDKKPMPKWAKTVLWSTVGVAIVGGGAWGTAYALTDPYQGRVSVTLP